MQVDEKALEQLKELIGNDQDALHELIASFLDDGRALVAQMQTACETQDVEMLHRASHTLKSGAADFGIRELSTLCATLEANSNGDWPDNADSQVSAIEQIYVASEQSLRDYVSRSS